MHGARRDLHQVAGVDGVHLQQVHHLGGGARLGEGSRVDAGREPEEDLTAWLGLEDEPALVLARVLASQATGGGLVGMDLHGEVLARVDQLDEQGEGAVGVRGGRPQERVLLGEHQTAEAAACKGTLGHH